MKKSAILLSLMFAITLVMPSAHAATKYVNDLMTITVRKGPGVDYKIIRTIGSGQALEAIKSDSGWTQVQLPDGATGWVVSRYLTGQKPGSLLAESLKAEIEPLRGKLQTLTDENQRLITMNQELADKLTETQHQLDALKAEYEALKAESTDYLKLKGEHDTLQVTLKEKNDRIETLEKQVTHSFLTSSLKWFLAGGGVLLLGIVMGHRAGARRKRSPLR